MPYWFFWYFYFWNGFFYFVKALPGKYGKQRYWQLPRRWMKVFPFVVFSTWLRKAIVLTVCLYKIKDCETSVKENLTIIQPGMLHRRQNKSPPAGQCWFTGLTSETPYMGMLYRWRVGALKPQFGALKRIVSDIEEPQQAAWVVFFKRLWVGRHASYACERIEALQKWSLHCMGPLSKRQYYSAQMLVIFLDKTLFILIMQKLGVNK